MCCRSVAHWDRGEGVEEGGVRDLGGSGGGGGRDRDGFSGRSGVKASLVLSASSHLLPPLAFASPSSLDLSPHPPLPHPTRSTRETAAFIWLISTLRVVRGGAARRVLSTKRWMLQPC